MAGPQCAGGAVRPTAAPSNETERRYRISASSRNVLAGGAAVTWLPGTGAGCAAPVGVVGST
jgi:hypothetical protein